MLSGAAAGEEAVSDAHATAGAQHLSPHVVEQQVAQLRSALSEMADRMAAFEKLLK